MRGSSPPAHPTLMAWDHDQGVHVAPSTASRPDPPGTAPSATAGTGLAIRVEVRRVVRGLALVVVALAVLGAASSALRLSGTPTAYGFVNLFNVDIEMSAPTWFSAAVLLAGATLLAVLGASARGRPGGRPRTWWLLAGLFTAMSIDEVAAYHESWVDRLRDLFDAGGIFYFAWVIPGSALVAMVALALIPFLRSLPPATARRFLLAGATFVSGALGMEMVNGWYVEGHGGENATYAVLVGVEELLEVVGAIAFLRALLLHLSATTGTVALTVAAGARR